MNQTISFKHSGNAGDIIYSLAGIKQVCEDRNDKAELFFWMNRRAHYYDGAVHPLKGLMFNNYMYKALKPLLLHQDYISKASKWEGEKIIVDLDLVRTREVGMPNGNISSWYSMVFPDMAVDLSKPWLKVDGEVAALKDCILVNRTQRYTNPSIAYSFLREYKDKVFFTGVQEEYEIFKKEVKSAMYLECSNFLDLARAIKSCRLFIGNQSMCFGIAEALKVPRILEVCLFAQNVQANGPDGYMFLVQTAFEYYVHHLWKQPRRPQPQPVVYENCYFDNDMLEKRIGELKTSNKEIIPKEVMNNTLIDFERLYRLRDYVRETAPLKWTMAEVGVYKGGSALLIRQTDEKRLLLLYDTFEGLPQVSPNDLHHQGDFADTSVEHVSKLLEDNTDKERQFLIYKGVFPGNVVETYDVHYSLVHIDVDIYKSVKDCLEYFYPRMITGGIIVLDDVLEPGCPGALDAYREFMSDKPEKPWMWMRTCQSQVAFKKH